MSAHDKAMADASLPPGVAEGRASMPGLLRYRAQHTPDQIALREKVRGVWQGVTWGEFPKSASFCALSACTGVWPG